MMYVFIFLTFLTCVSCRPSSSDLIKCPVIQPLLNFDTFKFSGKWYQVMIIPLPDGSPAPKCATEILTETAPPGNMILFTKVTDYDDQVYFRNGQLTPTKTRSSTPSTRTATSSSISSSIMSLLYPGDKNMHEYNIISTDYVNFAVIYSCTRIDDKLTVVTGQILSRSQIVPDDVMNMIVKDLYRYDIDLDMFTSIDQVSCYNMTR